MALTHIFMDLFFMDLCGDALRRVGKAIGKEKECSGKDNKKTSNPVGKDALEMMIFDIFGNFVRKEPIPK